MRRLALLVFAFAWILGSPAPAASSTPTEAYNRTGLLACSLVDEAVKLGADPRVVIPETLHTCQVWIRANTRRGGSGR